jgi:prephenate dehydrogenase
MPRTVAVIGLGLMGGSLARDFHRAGARVIGWDRDAATRRQALESGVIAAELPESLAGVDDADTLVLAVPVSDAPRLIEALDAMGYGGDVTDLGSTKRSVVEAASRLGIAARFVGSHPLVGDHRSGWSASRDGLYSGARVYLCATRSTDAAAIERVRSLWTTVGAMPVLIDADEHDRLLAWTSHLPQVAASALAAALSSAGVAPGDLGAGGRDMTRLAASSPELWAAICADNVDLVDGALTALEAEIGRFRDVLRSNDRSELERLFSIGREWAAPRGGRRSPE